MMMTDLSGPTKPNRVIIVSDTLPFSITSPESKADFKTVNVSNLSLGPTRQRRRRHRTNSVSIRSNSLEFEDFTNEPIPVFKPRSFELSDRPNHAAFWISSHLDNAAAAEVIHVGKPMGLESAQGGYYNDLGVQSQLKDLIWSEKKSIPVFIEESVQRGHWEGYCRSCIWPLFHYVIWDNNIGNTNQTEDWSAYMEVNKAFCNAIMSIWQPGDLVWILDYQLLTLPALLRTNVETMSIALYIRSPFPSSELIRCLPQAKEVLSGMLGANIIGFQTCGYARHFTSSCTRILGHESTPKGVDNAGMPVEVVVQPIGIDPDNIKRIKSSPTVVARSVSFKEFFGGRKVILGIESANQSRGVIHKLRSFEKLLSMYPELIGKVILVQVLLSNADQRGKLDTKISDLVSRINGMYGSLDINPVHVYHQVMETEEYYALLSIADILLLTSERDSVNTLILDYIACQDGKFGIPVISEFIGLAGILPPRVHVNPWDHSGIASVVYEVLTLPLEDRKELYEKLGRFVQSNTVQYWVSSFINSIWRSLNSLDMFLPTPFLNLEKVLGGYSKAASRLILLDYDGTLTPIRRVPSEAFPSQEVIRSLRLLTSDTRNYVYIISGRDQKALDGWIGNIPRLGMSAEHGCFLRPIMEPGETVNWMPTISLDDLSWKQDVIPIMEYYTERTPGSFIEFKTASITWHYRLADPDFGSWQSKELQNHLEQTIASKFSVEIIAGKKNLEVRPTSSNKGEIVKTLIARHGRPDFILCAGDDKTDEDMFRALLDKLDNENGFKNELAEWCFTCSIGPSTKKTLARYHVFTPEQIVSLLMRLCTLTLERVSGVTM